MDYQPLEIPKTRLSLSVKLTFGLILIIGIIFASINTFNILTSRKARRTDALTNAETVARVIAGALIAELANSDLDSTSNRIFLRNTINAVITTNKKNKDLAYAMVISSAGEMVAGRAKPNLVVFPGGKRMKDEKAVLAEIAKREGRLGGTMRTQRFPLQVGDHVVGRLIVGTSLARVEREVQRDVIISVSVLVGALLLLVIYSRITLGSMVIRPLNSVVSAMSAVHDGDLEQHIDTSRRDELGVLAHTYNFMVQGLKEREHLKDAFNKYVSDKVYEKMQAGELRLEGETRNATVLFSDIRSFTNLSEQLSPTEVVAMLNEYFSEMVEIVMKFDGFVNKFIGDALMAIYNVPLGQSHPELRAVCTALEMVEALARLNATRERRGQFPIKIGIGINTGPVVAGNIGHVKRLEYTVIGDTVNLAQRIESQTKVAGKGILISQTTYDAVASQIVAESLPPVKVKGKAEPVALYAVQSLRDAKVTTGTFETPTNPGAPPPAAPRQ